MRYVLLIYDDEKGWAKLSEAERRHYMGEFGKLRQEIAGQYVAGSQLQPTSATTSVRTSNGKRLVRRERTKKGPPRSAGLTRTTQEGGASPAATEDWEVD